MLAAFAAGWGVWASFLATQAAAGCIPALAVRPTTACPQGVEVSFAWELLRDIVVLGGILGLPLALIVSALAARFRVAVRLGTFGGLAFCALWLPFAVGARFLVQDQSFAELSRAVFVVLAVLIQVIVAGAAGIRVTGWRVLHALIAALVAAFIALIAVWAFDLRPISPFSPEVVQETLLVFPRAVGVGLSLALLVGLVEATAFWTRRRAQPVDPSPRTAAGEKPHQPDTPNA